MSADGDIENNTGQNNIGQSNTGQCSTGANEGDGNGTSETQAAAATFDAPDRDKPTEKSRRAAEPAAVPESVLPNKAAEDDPRRWGDQPDNYDHDAWLQEQKPPHWG